MANSLPEEVAQSHVIPTVDETSAFTPTNGGVPHNTPSVGDPLTGTRIGRYTLLQKLGEGGMGSVYLAEQSEPVKRQVALKLIRGGVDSRTVIARFEAERQALAVMDHPNIARIYDGGTTSSLQPFFVMELVKGVSITEYCDQHRLTLQQRLELFVPVCLAVQHAHQKGIIHRDLKPSNVLVAEVDGHAVPKVIDFGVAKATEQSLTDQSYGDTGAIVGTPTYMSPEQADPSTKDIDTRTDVYALGVILYELLVGSTPIDARDFKRGAIWEMLRMVREGEPPRPSTKLSTADALPNIAANRNIEPSKLSKLLKGELDWVVMKALEKDRIRRYETANGFARDIERYLADEVVEARPPSTGYRVRKFVRRNRSMVAAGSTVAAALLIGIIGFAWQAKVAGEQRDRAVLAEGETKKRADELQRVSDFQAQMLKQLDPAQAGLRLTSDVKARFAAAVKKAGVPEAERTEQVEAFANLWSRVNATDAALELINSSILKPAVETIDKQFKDQPVVEATLRQTLGTRYLELGLNDAAKPLLEQSLKTQRDVLGEDHPTTVISIGVMGSLLKAQGKLSQALPYFEQEMEKSRRVLGDDHHATLTAISNLGVLLVEQGKVKEAMPYYREALEKRRRLLGENHHDTLMSIGNMGTLLWEMGKRDEASPYYYEVLEKCRQVLGEDHPDTLLAMSNLGAILREQGKLNDAATYFREVLDRRRRLLGEGHPLTIAAVRNLGPALSGLGKDVEAEALMRSALNDYRRLLGADHPSTLIALSNLAVFLIEHGKLAEAEPMCRESLERNRRASGPNHPYTLVANNVMGYVFLRQNKPDKAEPFVREAIAMSHRINGENHKDTLTYIHNLGTLLRDQNKLTEAEPQFRKVVVKAGPALGPSHPITLSATINLAGLLNDKKGFEEAASLLTTAQPAARKAAAGGNARTLASLLTTLGTAQLNLKKFAEAEMNLLEAQPLWIKTRGETHKDTRNCIRTIVELYAAWHAAQPGKDYDTKAGGWKKKLDSIPK